MKPYTLSFLLYAGFSFNLSPINLGKIFSLISWCPTTYLSCIARPCLEHKSSLRVWSSGIEIGCHSDILPFQPLLTPLPTFPPPTTNNPNGKSGKSQFMGHVSRSLVLSGANKPLSARRLVSLLSTSSKLEIDFCLELKGLRPFRRLSSCSHVCVCVCVCLYTCLCMQAVCASTKSLVSCVCMCLSMLSL